MACCCLALVSLGILAIFAAFKIYVKLTRAWCKSQVCLIGKTVIVTGSNTGIGYEAALDFAKRGARVILACRNRERGEEARDKIVKATRNPNIVLKIINMSSLDSVRAFAKDINSTEERLDILVNNAGVGGLPDKQSEDGLQLLTQINYFSNFLLTNLLIGLLKKSEPSRIVNVSSIAAKYVRNFDVEKINEFSGLYYGYYNSKLCNVLFTKELAKRLEGTGVTTYSLHPGAVKTEIFRHATGVHKTLIEFLANQFFKSSEEGAQTTIYTAVAEGIEKYNGEHFDECSKVETYDSAKDPELPAKLWKKTLEILKVQPGEITL